MYRELEESIKWATKKFKLRFDMLRVKVMGKNINKRNQRELLNY
jgi:hypothetical protein